MKNNRPVSLLSIAAIVLTLLLPASAANTDRRGQLTGVVTNELPYSVVDGTQVGPPVDGATIRLYSLNRVLQTRSDRAGHFQFTDVPDDSYDLEIAASGFKTKSYDAITINGSGELHYDVALRISNPDCPPLDSVSYESSEVLSDPIVTGKVVDHGTQEPLGHVEVRLFQTSDKVWTHETNERGEFGFSLLANPPGKYFLQISRAGYQT